MKKILMLLAVTVYLFTNTFAQTYLIKTGWEDGNTVPSGAGSETTTSYGQQISSGYARSGNYSCRFEVRDSDTKIGGGVRSEQKTDMVFDQTKGDVAWVGYSIYYPSNMINTPQEEMIGQFMQTDNNGNYSPAVGFKNEGDFSLRAYVRQGSTSAIYNLPAFTFPKGEWVDFVWTVKFSLNSDGYIKCWCNGVQKINYTGKVGYPGGKANFKWGIYPGWKTGPNGQSPRVVFWDDLKVMHNNGSYDLVKPGPSVVKQNQTITFPTLPNKLTTDPDFSPGATASSGLPVSYSSSNTNVASIVNGNIHIVGAGSTTITASQAGNASYNPATNISRELIVSTAENVDSFTPVHDAFVRDNNTADGTGPELQSKNGSTTYKREIFMMFDLPSFNYTSISSAKLRLYCKLDEGGNSELYKVSNDSWTETGITWSTKPVSGVLIGSIAGNVGYMEWDVTSYINEELLNNSKASFRLTATADAFISFNSKEAQTDKPQLVITGTKATAKLNQTITFPAIPNKLTTDPDFSPGATASSGLPVSYSSSNTGVATIVSGNIHIVGAGNATITASQAGNASYNPASNVSQLLTVLSPVVKVTGVTVSPSTLSFSAIGTSQQLTATISPSNATNKNISWASSNTAVAEVDASGSVTAMGNGTAIITVSTQDGNFTASGNVIVETPGNGLRGDYFNNKTLTAPVVLSRIDPVVNFNWGSNSPGSGISNDNFSVRWTGFVKPQYSGTYTFYVNSNDGNRLWVNGVQLTNRWSDGASENYGTINLSAGTLYAITLEMYEGVNNASSVLSWSHANQAKQVIPQTRLFSSIGLKSGLEMTALDEELLPNEIKIYPIPVTSGVLTIDFGKQCTTDKKVTILNMQGSIVKSFSFAGSSATITMDKPGIFIAKVESCSKTYQKKVVVN